MKKTVLTFLLATMLLTFTNISYSQEYSGRETRCSAQEVVEGLEGLAKTLVIGAATSLEALEWCLRCLPEGLCSALQLRYLSKNPNTENNPRPNITLPDYSADQVGGENKF